MYKIKINNQEYNALPGQTIYEVAKENGIFIPTFCHDERLKPDASCRVCVVEIKGQPKLQTSCSTPIQDDMEIFTETEKVQKSRNEVIELMWSSHPNDCVVCDANEDCKLQDYMYLYNIKSENKYDGFHRTFEKDESNKFFYIDPEKCILCGKCVRICSELQGVEALGFNQRGHESYISFAYDLGMEYSTCVSCGNCVSSCPTGALMEKSKIKFRMHETKKTRTTCPYCGVGCQFDIVSKDNTIVKIEPLQKIPNHGLLCVKGKFAYKYVNHKDRLTTPLIKENGIFREASWEEAYELIHRKFTGYQKEFGVHSVAGLASAKCTNEENYIFQKFVRKYLQTNNVDHCARLCHASTVSGLATTLGSGAMTNSIAEVLNNEVIFITGSNTTETHPVIGSMMRQAKQKGAKIIVAEPRKIDIAQDADIFIQIKPGTNVALFNAMMKVIVEENLQDTDFIQKRTENYENFIKVIEEVNLEENAEICGCHVEDIKDAARMYATHTSGIYYAMGITQHSNGTNHVKSIANLALLTGNVGKENAGINPLRGQNNVQGACDMGGLPNNFPGYQKVFDDEARLKFEQAWDTTLDKNVGLHLPLMISGAYSGTIKAMYVMGENPIVSDPDINHVKEAFDRVDFLVVQDIFMTETAVYADVILPASTYAEKDGTFTNTERRVQRVRKAIEPIGNSKPDGLIIQELIQKFDKDYIIKTPKELMDEIAELTPIYHGVDYERIEETGLQWPVKDKTHKGTKFLYDSEFGRGKGYFTPINYKGAAELPDETYPFTLTTGRILYHYHTITMTSKNEEIMEMYPENFIEIHPHSAQKLKIKQDDSVVVSSRRGDTTAKVVITERIGEDVIFMPFHFADGANMLTNTVLDDACKIPELKVCAVAIRKA